MPRSDRRRNAKTVDWALPLVGLLLVIALAWGLGWLQAREEYKRKYATEAYKRAAQRDAESACIGTDPRAVFKCVNEKAETAYQTAHDEQDLSAQQRAASSALASVVLTFFSLILSGVGVWYVKRTLDATLEAVEDTSDATQAMMRQNEIAEKAQRAWITIDIEPIAMSPNENEREFTFDVVFTNIGQTATNFNFSSERFHPMLRKEIQPPAISRKYSGLGIPILPKQQIKIRVRNTFNKTFEAIVPWILVTANYICDDKPCVSSYAFRIEKRMKGGLSIWGGSLIGLDEYVTLDQIDVKTEHGITVVT